MSEANGVPPVAGLLDGRSRPFDSAQGPGMAIWGRGGPFGSAQGPGMAIRGRAVGLLVFWAVGPVVIDVVAVGSHRTG